MKAAAVWGRLVRRPLRRLARVWMAPFGGLPGAPTLPYEWRAWVTKPAPAPQAPAANPSISSSVWARATAGTSWHRRHRAS